MYIVQLFLNYIQFLLPWSFFQQDLKVISNACTTFEDYTHPDNNPNCFYNEDFELGTAEIITKYTNSLKTYQVTTEDGYILTLYRIIHSNPRKVVFLHHPSSTDSNIFVVQGNGSLAYNLWLAGYDVWLANQRGSPLSRGHSFLSCDDYNYWNFSFHEIAVFDVPSTIRFINNETGSKITYIGHSVGGTVGLIYFSLKSEEAARYIETGVIISPSVYYVYGTSSLKVVIPWESTLELIDRTFKLGNVYNILEKVEPIIKYFLVHFPSTLYYVNSMISSVTGWTSNETNPIFINTNYFKTIKSISYRYFFHNMQLARVKNRFQMYDFGNITNVKYYGDSQPPKYPLENIRVPLYLISMENDTLTTPQDTETLYEQLSRYTKVYGLDTIRGMNHMQIYLGKRQFKEFVQRLLYFLNTV